jgi:Cu/Ag efflux pump CusA
MTSMNKEIKEILSRVDAAVKDLENIEDSKIDIFEDLGVLISDVAQVLFAKNNKTKELEKKDAINTIVAVLSKVVNL